MKNFTRILIAASSVLMLSSNAYSQDVFRTANVGIGTTAPQQKLDVAGSIKFSNALMPNGVPGSTGNILLSEGAGNPPIWLANGTTGTILVANSSGVPTWSSVNSALTTSNIVNGGVNSAVVVTNGIGQVVGSGNVNLDVQGTAGGILYGQGTGNSAIFTSAGTSGQVLTSAGTGAPTWTTLTAGWTLNGNSNATATSILGTTDGSSLRFEVNNFNAGSIDPLNTSYTNANVYLGSFGYLGITTFGSAGNTDAGGQNVGIGISALGSAGGINTNSINTANVAVGAFALPAAVYGTGLVAVGAYSQRYANWSSLLGYDVAVGSYSMYSNTTGQNNTALGYQSMFGTGSPTAYGNYNTALGYNSFFNSSGGGGGSNTAVGSNSLYNSAGGKNTAVGDSALASNTTGEYNTALGYQANVSSGNLTNATAIGYGASATANNSITLGNSSVTSLYLPGYSSVGDILYTSNAGGQVAALTPGAAGTILESQGTSSVPTWISVAGINSVTGTPPIYVNISTPSSPNVYIQGLPNNSDAGGVLYSLGSGTSALFTPTPAASGLLLTSSSSGVPTWSSPAVSASAWALTGNANATATSILGTTDASSLRFEVNNFNAGSIDPLNTSYTNANVYLGSFGYLGITTFGSAGNTDAGGQNVGIGISALGSAGGINTNSINTANVAVGAFALPAAVYGTGLVAVGAYSQRYANWSSLLGYDVAVGSYSMYSNTTGQNNTALGYQSMFGTGSPTAYGNYNTALGYNSFFNSAGGGGGSNTALGSYSLYNSAGGKNTAVGDSTLVSNTTGEYNTALGYQANVSSGALTNATAIGYGASAGESNSLVLGNGAAFVGINTSIPAQLLEIGGTANTIRVDGLKTSGAYNNAASAGPGNIVYSNNANGDLYSLPNGSTGTVLTLNASGVPTWGTTSYSGSTYSITGNTGTSVVVGGGNLNSVIGTGNVTLDVQGTAGGVFYGNGAGNPALFTPAGTANQVLQSNGTGIPTWATLSVPNAWSIVGNSGTTPGTNFIGTLDDNPLEFEVGGYNAGSLDALNNNYTGANVYLGGASTSAPILPGAGNDDRGDNNVGIGLSALASAGGEAWEGSGTYNNGISYISGNVAVGVYSLSSAVYGGGNTALGAWSQRYFNYTTTATTTGNTSAGAYSLFSNSIGTYNTAIGVYSMYGSGSSTATGSFNTAEGYKALYNVGAGEASNTAIGSNALLNTTSSRNVGVGDSALVTNTSGINNTALGYDADMSANNLTNAIAIGYQASAPASNSVTLGNSSVTSLYLPGYSAVGDLLYTSTGTGLVTGLTPGTAGTVLASGGPGVPPSWISVAGINTVTGTAPIYSTGGANPVISIQGTNANEYGVLYSTGAGNSAAFTSAGTAGYVLESTGTGAPTWVSPSSTSGWSLSGNSSTNPSTNFIGTLDDNPLEFEVGGYNAGSLDALNNNYTGANVYLGGASTSAPILPGAGNDDRGDNNVAIGLSALSSAGGSAWQGSGTYNTGTSVISGNVAVGVYALSSAVYGGANTALGAWSQRLFNYPTTGTTTGNTSAGAYSLFSNSIGTYNTAIGIYSMYGSGSSTATGSFNTAEGYKALYNVGAGEASNTAIGSNALLNTISSRNVGVGDSALVTNTSGINNTALGYDADMSANNLTNAIAIGYQASAPASNSVTLGNSSVTSLYLPGYSAVGDLLYTSTGTGLVTGLTPGVAGTVLESQGSGAAPTWISVTGANSVGGVAPIYITGTATAPIVNIQGLPNNSDMGGVLYSTGANSSALFTPTPIAGGLILESSAGGAAPTWTVAPAASNSWLIVGNGGTTPGTNFVGTTSAASLTFKVDGNPAGSLDYSGGNQNAYFGYGTGNSTSATGDYGQLNVGMGVYALASVPSGATVDYDDAIGAYALYSSASGTHNTAFGAYSQYYGNGGTGFNTTVGAFSLYSNSTGSYETAIGYNSMYGSGSSGTIGAYNTAIGYNSLYKITTGGSNTAVGSNALLSTTAGKNTAVGDSALASNTTGEFNTAVGYQALTTALTTGGNYNTALGYNANVSSGTISNATAIGANAYASASNTLILGGISGVNGATANTNVAIGTNTPDADAALAVKTLHIETQAGSIATAGIYDPASGNLSTPITSLVGTDVAGNATWTEGINSPSSGAQVQINFATAYTSAPTVIITAANTATGAAIGTLFPYVSGTSTSGFIISFAAGTPVSGTLYSFNYFVIESQ